MIRRIDPVRRIDQPFFAANKLISHWLGLKNLDRAGAQNQIAIAIDSNPVNAFEAKSDSPRVAARADVEIVFKPLLIRFEQ
jgi:hypothetical protein